MRHCVQTGQGGQLFGANADTPHVAVLAASVQFLASQGAQCEVSGSDFAA